MITVIIDLEDEESPVVIHGLNAIYLKSINKWIRLDSRGNKPDVNAQFSLFLWQNKLRHPLCINTKEDISMWMSLIEVVKDIPKQ